MRLLLLVALIPTLLAAAPASDYLEDGRTARAVTLTSPRAPLGECLRLVSEAGGVPLSAAASLEHEPLTGHVARRPLRETMAALADLYDGRWTAKAGGYVLEPDAAKWHAVTAARERALQRTRKLLDDAAAEAVRRARTGEPLPGETSLRERFPPLVWSHLAPAERDRVLRGESVTITIPQARAAQLYTLMVPMSGMEPKPLAGAVLATVDLDDRAPGRGFTTGETEDYVRPALRARATAPRENSFIGAIHTYDFLGQTPRPAPREEPAAGPLVPPDIAPGGQVAGTRDEVVVRLAAGAGIPLLSRHRPIGGTFALMAGGRHLSQALAELAAGCAAEYRPSGRDFHLFRSSSEAMDPSAVPPPAALRAYLPTRPAPEKVVPLSVLMHLGGLTPLQLSYLARSNVCSDEAEQARDLYAVLRFYRALSPEQRAALSAPEGLDATGITHAQVHALLDDKLKRADWEVHSHLQNVRGLRFRILEEGAAAMESLTLLALRDGMELSRVVRDRPIVEEEERPSAEGPKAGG